MSAVALLAGSGRAARTAPAAVDRARIAAAERSSDWLTHGRTYSEQRFSPLKQIDLASVAKLGPAWSADFDTDRGQEATPLEADGVIYTSTAWSKVFAFDARTGNRLWGYDPKVDGAKAFDACCDVVNRGVALWKGKVFVGALDGRLIALDAKTGKPVWSVQTTDPTKPYTITGAPRVVRGKVLIGNGGAEYGVRGYLSAYDAETGRLAWRFFATPNPQGKPDHAASDAVMARLAGKTWFGDGWRKTGGGGTPWDAIAYDEKLDILYVGMGNGSPWNHQKRSDGKGDNLFLSSVVALKPETGAYVWHYQTTPGESWDYTAAQQIVLADLTLSGQRRRVVMQAPKIGFFYVLDAATGKLISADKYVPVNWADHVDLATGRPVEDPRARYLQGPSYQTPSPLGGHNWQSMAYAPTTGLVYIPARVLPGNYSDDPAWTFLPGAWNTAEGGRNTGPENTLVPAAPSAEVKKEMGGRLVAWDPVAKTPRWVVRQAGTWSGGVLATAGGLVFEGAEGDFRAYDAASGALVWSYPVGVGIIAAPMTYNLDGEQYLAVMAGWGGAGANNGSAPRRNGRLLVFKIGGTGTLTAQLSRAAARNLDPSAAAPSAGDPKSGGALYNQFCNACHRGGVFLPNLRASQTLLSPQAWKAVVYDGALRSRGMAPFSRFMTAAQVEDLRAFLLKPALADTGPAPDH